jgi:hypothetical protein
VIALIVGLITISILGDLPGKINPSYSFHLAWTVSFTWFAFIGAAAVLLVGIWFKTPDETLSKAERREIQAQTGEDVPLAMRAG